MDSLAEPWDAFGLEESAEQKEGRMERMKGTVRILLECGHPDREGLLATLGRYAKAILFFRKG